MNTATLIIIKLPQNQTIKSIENIHKRKKKALTHPSRPALVKKQNDSRARKKKSQMQVLHVFLVNVFDVSQSVNLKWRARSVLAPLDIGCVQIPGLSTHRGRLHKETAVQLES